MLPSLGCHLIPARPVILGAPQNPAKGALPPSEPPAGACRTPCAPLRSGKSDLWNHMLDGLVSDFEKTLAQGLRAGGSCTLVR